MSIKQQGFCSRVKSFHEAWVWVGQFMPQASYNTIFSEIEVNKDRKEGWKLISSYYKDLIELICFRSKAVRFWIH